ncbi:MAG: hypothetical protein AB7G68_00005 [Nitrospiraceae bacterium]
MQILDPAKANTVYDIEPNKITFTIQNNKDGWLIHAKLPDSVSDADRETVLRHLKQYEEEIRRLHPNWDVLMISSGSSYSLYVRRYEDVRQKWTGVFNRLQRKVGGIVGEEEEELSYHE